MNRLDDEAERSLRPKADAYDEALAASYVSPKERTVLSIETGEPPDEPAETLADKISALLRPWSDDEIEAAKTPWPHVFSGGERGIFPVGEVSIVGARGREGKTTILTAIATAAAVGQSIVGLTSPATTTVIYSAEDDRQQYARKIGAQMSILAAERVEKVRHRILVPDLDDPSVAAARDLVMVFDRQPMPTGTVDAVIDALRPLLDAPAPLRLVVFETASTLSDAEEDNRGHKVLVAALKRIARALGVAVVLVHHTSQQADNDLADLNVSTSNIRGGTSLVFNGRQTWLLVNLGSDPDPFPDADARTVLRRMVCDGARAEEQHRLLALICLDSSKSAPVPPVFFKWLDTVFGPVAVDIEAPANLVDRPWRKVHEMVRAERATLRSEAKQEAKQEARHEHIDTVVAAVAALQAQGRQATVNAVAGHAERGNSWAKAYLTSAVSQRRLRVAEERVKHVSGLCEVFYLNNSSASQNKTEESV